MQSIISHLQPAEVDPSHDSNAHSKLAPSTISDPALLDKVALITGGTRGIGRATALHLASLGFHLSLVYGTSTKNFSETKALVDKLGKGTKVFGVQVDLSSIEGPTEAVDKTVGEFGKVDVLINNAGIAVYHDLFQATAEDFDRTYALNQRAPFLLAKAVVPHMPKGGRIIFISSSLTAANTVTPAYAVYLPAKGAIEQLARVLAKTLAAPPHNILVNTVSPGPTATDLFYNGKTEAQVAFLENLSPFKRVGKPEEIAEAIGYLATSGSWIAGHNLRVNGGAIL